MTRQEQLCIRFGEWLEKHPRMWTYFDQFALQATIMRDRYGVAAVVERARWEMDMATAVDEFKIPNAHRAFLARLWMLARPEHDGFFRTCRQPSAQRPAKRGREAKPSDLVDAVNLNLFDDDSSGVIEARLRTLLAVLER